MQNANIKYTLDAVELAKRLGCKTFIGAGSQAEYGRVEGTISEKTDKNPENGYALAWIATVRNHLQEYGKAITAVNLAIKHIPKKDKTYKAFAHSIRADIYINIEDKESALKDYNVAIEYTPNDEDIYEKRAQLYFEMEKYNLADEDYKKNYILESRKCYGIYGDWT